MAAERERDGWWGVADAALYGNAVVALAAGVYTAADAVRAGGVVPWALVLVVVTGALVAYGLDRLTDPVRGEGARAAWLRAQRRRMVVVAGVAAGLGAVAVWWVGRSSWWALGGAGLVSLGYCVPCLPWRLGGRWRRLREVPYAKAFLVALAWALATSVAPAVGAGADWREVVRLGTERGLFVLAAALPFDVRDLARDARDGVRTLPMAVGLGRLRAAVGVTALGAAAVAWSGSWSGGHAVWPTAWAGGALVVLAGFAGPRRGEWYYLGGIDGLMVVHGGMLLVAALG